LYENQSLFLRKKAFLYPREKIMKTIIYMLSALALSTSASQADSLYNELKACSENQAVSVKAQCYDQVVNRIDQYADLNSFPGTPPATKPDAQNTVPAATMTASTSKATHQATIMAIAGNKTVSVADQKDAFGLEHKVILNKKLKKLSFAIKDAKKSLRGKWLLTLENGQSWKQFDNTKIRLKAGQQITIARGALNSFYLTQDGSNRKMLIKRSL
jgi:hypothetical protein